MVTIALLISAPHLFSRSCWQPCNGSWISTSHCSPPSHPQAQKVLPEYVLHLFFSLHWVIISTSLAKVLILCFRTEFLLANVFEHSSHFICKNVSSTTLNIYYWEPTFNGTSSMHPHLHLRSPLAWLLIFLHFSPLCSLCKYVLGHWVHNHTVLSPKGNSPLSGLFSSSILLHLRSLWNK